MTTLDARRESLILAIEDVPVIWCKDAIDAEMNLRYGSKDKIKAWEKVLQIIGNDWTIDEARKTWAALRYRMTRVLKKCETGNKPSWQHFHSLGFLINERKRKIAGFHENDSDLLDSDSESEQRESLISAIKNVPVIWCKDAIDTEMNLRYGSKGKIKAWEKVLKVIGNDWTIDEAKKTWTALRDRLNKELKRYETGNTSSWKHFNSLSFLIDQKNRKIAGLNENDSEPLDSDSESEHSENGVKINFSDLKQAVFKSSQDQPQVPQVKQNISRMKTQESEPLKAIQEAHDEDRLFALSLVPYLNKFPPAKKLRLQAAIMNNIAVEMDKSMKT